MASMKGDPKPKGSALMKLLNLGFWAGL